MPDKTKFLDISLFGKEYRIACPPEESEALLKAVAYVDATMQEISKKTKSNIGERIAVMAALNIAHEHLLQQKEDQSAGKMTGSEIGLDFTVAKHRISAMEAQLEAVLQQGFRTRMT